MAADSEPDRPTPGHDEIFCTSCGAIIKERAELCPECGVRNAPAGAGTTGKDRTTAALFALLLGGLGAHHFYLGNTTRAVLYLVFFWTFIPAMVSFVEGIIYLTKTDAEFQAQYVDGPTTAQPTGRAETSYCSSCGEQLADGAERCPACGVPTGGVQSTGDSAPTSQHDPADYTTTVGPNWYYGVITPPHSRFPPSPPSSPDPQTAPSPASPPSPSSSASAPPSSPSTSTASTSAPTAPGTPPTSGSSASSSSTH